MIRKNQIPFFLMAIYLLAILFLNWTYQFCSDDCVYGLCGLVGVAPPPHVSALPNAWIENWNDGYRPIVHLFVRVFTGCFDKWFFNLANTAMMGCLLICAYGFAQKNLKLEFESLSLLLVLVFFILCKGESYLWCAGSINYLWAGTCSLMFCSIVEHLERVCESRRKIVAYCIFALFAGWLQESFVLPICCAICAYYLLKFKSFSRQKAAILLCYMIGAILLIRVAGRRASTIPLFTLSGIAMTLIKVAVAVKATWIMLIVFLARRDKKAFLRRNAFPILVVLASICMISIIGFNGERSLWAANLFSIIVIVRECHPSRTAAYHLSAILLIALCICCFLGLRIHREFDIFTEHYLASSQGLCWHNRVNCGPFARFFHQSIFTWHNGLHGKAFARFHGREMSPVAFQKDDYDALLSDSFCVPSNRLPTEVEAYSPPDSNTIVIPLQDSDTTPTSVRVDYDLPNSFLERLRREIDIRRNPPVADPNIPRIVSINGKKMALVSKLPKGNNYIRHIKLEYDESPRG